MGFATCRFAVGVAILSVVCASSARADIVAQWTFDSTTVTGSPSTSVGPIAADSGTAAASSFASGLHASANTLYSTPVGNGSAKSLSSSHWGVGDYYQFTTSTIGMQNIKVSWDQISSITGPGYFGLSYSTDGTNFTQFYGYNPGTINWSSSTYHSGATNTVDLSSVTALNDASLIYFRLSETQEGAAGGGPVQVGGTSTVDTFTISTVPEPSSLLLTGLVASGLGGWQLLRRKLRGQAATAAI